MAETGYERPYQCRLLQGRCGGFVTVHEKGEDDEKYQVQGGCGRWGPTAVEGRPAMSTVVSGPRRWCSAWPSRSWMCQKELLGHLTG
jgi:hypothetical protein